MYLFVGRNKEEMVRLGALPNVNVTTEVYEMTYANLTKMNTSSIMECSLQKQLDQVKYITSQLEESCVNFFRLVR